MAYEAHDYRVDCQCFRCKGIRHNPHHPQLPKRGLRAKAPRKERIASREEQHARYIDCGPANWDDR